ncbi:MAG TPA: hypothetical protein VF594_08490 [Rubricoccaceae bacterium]|jgi:hypothetical protein
MSARLRPTSAPRTGLFLTLGAALVAPTGAAVVLAGCQEEAPPAPAADIPITGVETVIRQLPDGSYQIADEQIVEGRAGGVTIIHTDASAPGGTRTERLDSPEAFAARLPATPPDSASVASGGGGGSFGGQQAQASSGGGFGLGNILLMSMMFNMWRPPYYAGYGYGAPSRAYANEGVRRRSQGAVRSGIAAAGRRGTLATPTRVAQRAAATRAARPSGGRSGAFSRGFGGSSSRSGGG